MSPAWLESPENIENEVLVQLLETELRRSLTEKQLSFYEECLMGGISVSEYARRHNIRADSAKDLKTAIQKKYKNIFLTDTPKRQNDVRCRVKRDKGLLHGTLLRK